MSRDFTNALILVGNSGAGKSYLLNKLGGNDRFKSRVSPISVTRTITEVKTKIGNESCSVLDIPGLMEVKKEKIEENKKMLKKALEMFDKYKIAFVFGTQGGRLQTADIATYDMFIEAYGLSSSNVPIIINQVPSAAEEDYVSEVVEQLGDLLRTRVPKVFSIKVNEPDKLIQMIVLEAFNSIVSFTQVKQVKELDLDANSETLKKLIDQITAMKKQMDAERQAYEKKLGELDEYNKRMIEQNEKKMMIIIGDAAKERQAMEERTKEMIRRGDEESKARRELESEMKRLDEENNERLRAIQEENSKMLKLTEEENARVRMRLEAAVASKQNKGLLERAASAVSSGIDSFCDGVVSVGRWMGF